MADANDYSSIGPLNATTQKEAFPLLGMIALDMVVTVVGLYIAGAIVNSMF